MHNRYNKGVPVRISCTGGTKGVHYIRGFYTFVVPLVPNAHFLIIVPRTLSSSYPQY